MSPPPEKAILVGVELKTKPSAWRLRESLDELARLADTAGLQVVGTLEQRLERINPATLIGSGKVDELVALRADTGATAVIFDDELSPAQQRELERALGTDDVKVLDRTTLILDIFAQHARTREGAVQVELAQYEYRLPRLTRAWTHLARQGGGAAGRGGTGGVGLRGPGETQLEVDRREIRRRIAHLKQELEEIRGQRAQHRRRRFREALPVVALVGYTNAGKSTLLNTLCGSDVLAADQLFVTLDPTTRRISMPGGREVLMTDTVGFIQKLPTTLVAAFRATLEEVSEADLLLHVVDATHHNAWQQVQAVQETLGELDVADRPLVLALNKCDRLGDDMAHQLSSLPGELAETGVPISALTGQGVPALLQKVEAALYASLVPLSVVIPYQAGRIIALFHEQGIVDSVEHLATGVRMRGKIPERAAGHFRPYLDAGKRTKTGAGSGPR